MPFPRLFLFLSVSLLFSCELKTDSRLDADRINKRMDSFKIKRVTDDQIVAAAYERGAEVSQRLLGKLSTDSLCQYQELSGRIPQFGELVRSAQVRCEAAQTAHPKERELWEAYSAAFSANSASLSPAIQRLGDKGSYDALVFTHPINQDGSLVMLSIILEKKVIIRDFQPEN